jgi:hypothetical protein
VTGASKEPRAEYAGGIGRTVARVVVRLGVAFNHGQWRRAKTTALMYEPALKPSIMQYQEGTPTKLTFAQVLPGRIVIADAAKA